MLGIACAIFLDYYSLTNIRFTPQLAAQLDRRLVAQQESLGQALHLEVRADIAQLEQQMQALAGKMELILAAIQSPTPGHDPGIDTRTPVTRRERLST